MSIRRIGKAYSTSLLNVVSGLLSSLVLLRVVVSRVDVADFGLYMLVFQTTAFLGIAQLGLDLAAVRQIAEHLERNAFEKAAGVYRALLRFNLAVAALVVGGSIAAMFVMGFCGVGSLLITLVGLVGFTQAVTFASRPFTAALTASHFQSTANIISVFRSIFTTLLSLAFVFGDFGVIGLPLGELIATSMALMILNFQRMKKSNWTAGPSERAPLALLLKFGALTGLGGLGWTFESASDVYIVKGFSGEGDAGNAEVAEYGFWNRMPQLAFLLSTQFAYSAFPTMAARQTSDLAERRRFFTRMAWIVGGFAGLLALGLSAWLPPFVHHWLAGKADRPDGPQIAILVAAVMATRLFGNFFGMYWLSTGKAGLTSFLNWAQAAIKIAISIGLYSTIGFSALFSGSLIACVLGLVVFLVVFQRTGLGGWTGSLMVLAPIGIGMTAGLALQPRVSDVDLSGLILGILATAFGWVAIWFGLMKAFGVLGRRTPKVEVSTNETIPEVIET